MPARLTTEHIGRSEFHADETVTHQTTHESAQGSRSALLCAPPAYQELLSFGTPSTGAEPHGELMRGTDGALYGTASEGGSNGFGTVYKLNADGSGFTVLKNFDAYSGRYPLGGLIQGTNGTLYGTASDGGRNGDGTVFKLNPDGTGFTVLVDFGFLTIGGDPVAGLIQGADGALYGTTRASNTGFGTVFKLNPDGTGFTVLVNFDLFTTGGFPRAGLIQGADGALYGTAELGGAGSGSGTFGDGTVFKVNPDGTGFTVLLSFDHFTTGSWPGGLIQAADHALYGTARNGGSSFNGTVYKLNPDGSGFTVLVNFDLFTTGGFPRAGLIQGTDGALYGTATEGGISGYGTVYKLNPDGSGFNVLQDFDGYNSGGYPYAALMQATDSALYGTAVVGGSNTYGTVFKLNLGGTGFTVLWSFDPGRNGTTPRAGLIQGTDGALYGTAYDGGVRGVGTVYKLNPDGTDLTVLKELDFYEGGYPNAGLIQGTDGALYGTAYLGGAHDGGTVYRLNPDGTAFTVLKDLDFSTTGGGPSAGLIQGADGALYGTASVGGSNNDGTVFKLNLDGTGFTVLVNFDRETTGAGPQGGLTQGPGGELYGTTAIGGGGYGGEPPGHDVGGGTVFKINPDGTGFAVLRHLDYFTTGAHPYAGLTHGADGTLYGTARLGGTGYQGTVFRLNPDGTSFNVIHNFDVYTGALPIADLIFGSDGNLYGTAPSGGSNLKGTAFKLNPDGSGFTVLRNLDDSTPDEKTGYSGLMQGADGAFYGTSAYGGSNHTGAVFRIVAFLDHHAPTARCKNVTAIAGSECTASASIDDGSFDADGGDAITVTQTPAGPYSLGDTPVTLTVTDCGGMSSSCTANVTVPDGTPCYDGNNCTQTDTCQLGLGCVGGNPVTCTASDQCHDVGTCSPSTGVCSNPDKANGTACDDGSACTLGDSCQTVEPGAYPSSGLIRGADGALYGTSPYGGSNGYGTIFKINTDGTGFRVLAGFDSITNGAYPFAGLVQAAGGALFGVTTYGGANDNGTVFKLNPDGTGFAVLLTFDRDTTGAYPEGSLIQGADGALYGTASGGGIHGNGTVFRLNPDGSGFGVVASFDDYSTSGGGPSAGLIQGTDGALYGVAYGGGSTNDGTVFKVNPDGTGFTVLADFDYLTMGSRPAARLLQAPSGTLYGTTLDGGSNGGGTVFRLNPDGSGFVVLENFGWAMGRSPAGLIRGTDGALYGTTSDGGANFGGTVYTLNPDGTGFAVLLNLGSPLSAANPYGELVQGPDGALYGTTASGGSSGGGTVFKVNADGTGLTLLENFASDPVAACTSGTQALDCNDGNPCTDDSCIATTGCSHANSTAPCDDGNACTVGDVCAGGGCHSGAPVPLPGEVEAVRLVGGPSTTMSWAASGGGDYDVASSTISDLRSEGAAGATCLDNDVAGLSLSDVRAVPPGDGYYYLVRAQTSCGSGNYGHSSAGVERMPIAACP